MPMETSIIIHDWSPSQSTANTFSIDSQVFRKDGQFSVRFAELSIITTRERLKEMRDKINIALCCPVADAIEPEESSPAENPEFEREFARGFDEAHSRSEVA